MEYLSSFLYTYICIYICIYIYSLSISNLNKILFLNEVLQWLPITLQIKPKLLTMADKIFYDWPLLTSPVLFHATLPHLSLFSHIHLFTIP